MWDLALKESKLEITGSENCENLCSESVEIHFGDIVKFSSKDALFRIDSILF